MQAVVCKVDDLFEWATENLEEQQEAFEVKQNKYQELKTEYKKSWWYKIFRTKFENTAEGDTSWMGSWDMSINHYRINLAEQMLRTINYQKSIEREIMSFQFPSESYEQDFYRFIESKSK